MRKQKFYYSFRLNTLKSRDNESPIYTRVYIDGRKSEFSTKIYVSEQNWDSKKQKVRPSAKNSQLINANLDKIGNRLNEIYLELQHQEKMVTSSAFKNLFFGISDEPKQQHKTILDAFEYHQIKMMDKVKIGNISKATHTRYKITKDKVVAFMQHQYEVNDMDLPSIRLRFISEFEHYLLTVQCIQTNTAHKYIKNVKAIMNLAVGLDWIPNNPFNLFKCSYTAPEREILNHEELYSLQHKKIDNQRLSEVRDVFVFCCYTGFAYTDVYQFERDAVMRGLDNELWLSTNRQKTGTKESVPLLPVAIEIIEKYQDHPHCVKYNKLLPVNSNQKYNAYLSEIATICNIKKHLTSHIARHTFATTVTLANGVPIETVSSMLGHTSIRTTQIYAKVVEKKVSEDMQLLRAKLFGSKTEEQKLKIG